jgi:hypothetical protein
MKKLLFLLTILLVAVAGSSHATTAGLLASGAPSPTPFPGNTVVNVSPGSGTISAAVNANGGNTTYMLQNGNYTDANITCNAANMQFIGSDSANVKVTASSQDATLFVNNGANFFQLWGLTLDAAYGNGAIIVGQFSDLLIQNCHIQNYASDHSGYECFPLQLWGVNYGPANQLIDHCQFTPSAINNVDGTSVVSCGEVQPSNNSSNYSNITISNNLFDTPTDTGTLYYHCLGSAQTISGNVFVAPSFSNGAFWYTEPGSWGIAGNESNGGITNTLSGNTVTLSGGFDFAQIVCHPNGQAENLVITGNTIHGSSLTGGVVNAISGTGCCTFGPSIAGATVQNNSIDPGVRIVMPGGCPIGLPLTTSPNNGKVQHAYNTPQSTAISTVSEAYSGAQSVGDLNIVAIGYGDTAGTTTVSSVTDTEGNTYSLASGLTRGTGIAQSLYYCSNIASAADK